MQKGATEQTKYKQKKMKMLGVLTVVPGDYLS